MRGKLKDNSLLILVFIIACLLLAIWVFTFVNYQVYAGKDFGVFNAIASLISLFAFAGVTATLYFQYRQLKSQQEQFFYLAVEPTLFKMMDTQRQLIDQMEYTALHGTAPIIYKGRNVFGRVRSDLIILDYISHTDVLDDRLVDLFGYVNLPYICEKVQIPSELYFETEDIHQIGEIIKNIEKEVEPLKWGRFMYEFMKDVYFSNYDHYYSLLYQTLNFIYTYEQKELSNSNLPEDIQKKYKAYADIVKVQLSTAELFVLFSYSLCYPKMKELLKYYKFLEELANDTPDSPYLNQAYNELYR